MRLKVDFPIQKKIRFVSVGKWFTDWENWYLNALLKVIGLQM